MNRIILIGNVGKDPELKQINSDTSVVKFPVATNENYKDKSGEWQSITEWHNVEAWKGTEYLAQRLHKGCLVAVEGKITTQKWQDKDGNERYTTIIRASSVKPLEKKTDELSKKTSQHFKGATDGIEDLPY